MAVLTAMEVLHLIGIYPLWMSRFQFSPWTVASQGGTAKTLPRPKHSLVPRLLMREPRDEASQNRGFPILPAYRCHVLIKIKVALSEGA